MTYYEWLVAGGYYNFETSTSSFLNFWRYDDSENQRTFEFASEGWQVGFLSFHDLKKDLQHKFLISSSGDYKVQVTAVAWLEYTDDTSTQVYGEDMLLGTIILRQ